MYSLTSLSFLAFRFDRLSVDSSSFFSRPLISASDNPLLGSVSASPFPMKSNCLGISLRPAYSPMVTETDLIGFFNVAGPVLCELKYNDGGFGSGDAGFVILYESMEASSAESPLALAISCAAHRPIVPFRELGAAVLLPLILVDLTIPFCVEPLEILDESPRS